MEDIKDKVYKKTYTAKYRYKHEKLDISIYLYIQNQESLLDISIESVKIIK